METYAQGGELPWWRVLSVQQELGWLIISRLKEKAVLVLIL